MICLGVAARYIPVINTTIPELRAMFGHSAHYAMRLGEGWRVHASIKDACEVA